MSCFFDEPYAGYHICHRNTLDPQSFPRVAPTIFDVSSPNQRRSLPTLKLLVHQKHPERPKCNLRSYCTEDSQPCISPVVSRGPHRDWWLHRRVESGQTALLMQKRSSHSSLPSICLCLRCPSSSSTVSFSCSTGHACRPEDVSVSILFRWRCKELLILSHLSVEKVLCVVAHECFVSFSSHVDAFCQEHSHTLDCRLGGKSNPRHCEVLRNLSMTT